MSSTFNQQPYFDDYNQKKGFHKVLFIPKKAVQVRELNQIQSIFQNQIQQLSDNIFTNGAMVIPGNSSLDTEFPFVKVVVNDYENVKDQLNNQNITVVGATTGIKANLLLVSPAEGSDPVTLYVQYANGGTTGLNTVFGVETLSIYDANQTLITTAQATACGFGTRANVNSGVYYVNGYFVYVDAQQILLSKYTQTPTVKVGFDVVETFVTSDDDESLYDNAQSTPNYKAPGAHRYHIELQLNKYASTDTIPTSFVQTMSIVQGEIETMVRATDYSLIEDTLAKRTYDESGDYTVEPFTIGLREHRLVDNNNGLYVDGDLSKFVVAIEKGRAYVRGYEVENNLTLNIAVDKARDTEVINNSSISAPIGYYIETNTIPAIPAIGSFQKMEFYNGLVSTPNGTPAGSVIGYGYIRFVRKISNTQFRLYVFNLTNLSGVSDTTFIKNMKSVKSGEGVAWSANTLASSLYSTSDYRMMFPLAASNIKTLMVDGSSDTSFTTVKQYSVTADSNGSVTLIASSSETFVAQDSQYGFAIFSDYSIVNLDGNYVIGGSPSGKTLTINFGSGKAAMNVVINVQVAKETTVAKSKSVQTSVYTGAYTSQMYLGKADAFELVSVKLANNTDVTRAFTLYPNRKETYYDISYIAKTDSSIITSGDLTVTFKYFDHGPGDYFSVDSYGGVDYQDIPKESIGNTIYRLSDLLDFRPRINSSRTGFSGDAVVGSIPTPYSIIRVDTEHYLPRVDKLWVDSAGTFGVLKGEPSLTPVAPSDMTNAMTIYTLDIPAYTADASEIKASQVNNKRYTMRDIGKLENRISNLEYYVSLNSLETATATMQITDPETGLNRFKNGFVVDQFIDHSVGDYTWDGYKCSVSPEDSELRPQFSMNGVSLEIASGSGYVVKDDLIMLPYTEVTYLSQSLASSLMNVNPYAVYRWEGSLKLTPSFDSWHDTQYTDPAVTYAIYNNGKLTQTWKAWSLYWSGSSSTKSSTSGSTTTTTNTTTSVKQVDDVVVNTSIIPYMRNVQIAVSGKGFRPGAVVYPFFDGVRVSSYVKPSGGVYGGTLKPDVDGNLNCTFNIPAGKFRTGTKKLMLIDNTSMDKTNSYSYGENNFTSTGVLYTRQKQYVATRSITTSSVTRSTNRDPLAQSFLVEMDGGVFLTSVDVYFGQKDNAVPITLGIYTMENGYPTPDMVPGSEVTLLPSEVAVSQSASTATRFTFDYPIYLDDSNEYCFILMSNSNMYEAWTARMGEPALGSGLGIAKQPFVGVLFKSQNASTWTADQTADLKFKLNRANFTSMSGSVVLNNVDTPVFELDDNPFVTTQGSTSVTVLMEKHNFVPGANIQITGAAAGGGLTANQLNKQHEITSVLDFNRFVITVSSAATTSGFIGGTEATITQNYMASHVFPHFSELGLSNTATSYTLSGMRGKTLGGSEDAYGTTSAIALVNDGVNSLSEPLMIGSAVDEAANYNGAKSLTINVTLTTDKSNITPVVDLQNSNLVYIYNEIDNQNSVLPDGSTTWAKYRTNVVGLTDAANSLKTYIDIMKPQVASVYVSYRTGNSILEVESAAWQLMDSINVQTSQDTVSFLENEYGKDAIGDFTYFQVMIQMRSSSCTKPPVLKRFRTLALGT